MNHPVLNLLKRCQTCKSLKSIHCHLFVTGSVNSSDLVLNKLLRLYSRFGVIAYARKAFDEIPQPNAFLWTALIHGYVENRQYEEAISLFFRMHNDSIVPLNFTVASVLKALARLTRVKDGEAVCGIALKSGCGFDLVVQNAVIDFYTRCGKLDTARLVFDQMDEKDVVSWNAMISAYASNDRLDIARELFDSMPERNVISWTSMISGYVKSGDILEAKFLFDRMPSKDSASLNVMLSAYIDFGNIESARCLFEVMPDRDVGIWNLMLSGLCKAGDFESAKDYFDRMPKRNVASWTIMLDGYMKSGDVSGARCIFDKIPEKNLVSWSTMIWGYARNSQPRNALDLLKTFKEQGIRPDETFILAIISACSQLGILDIAESIINDCEGTLNLSNIQVVTSLVDMYAKSGNIEKAVQVFKRAYKKDLVCYSTMISALANHGLGQEAISLFEEMKNANIKPDEISFLGVLSACNHSCLVEEGWMYFKQMKDEYGIHPSQSHYACVVDLLGRAGCLEEAFNLICNMPVSPHSAVWGALLAACRVHCNVQMAEIVASELFKIEPNNSGNYILLSNIYAAAGRWDGVSKVRAMIREQRVRKNKGSSWIELGFEVHEFVMGDRSHADSESIYVILGLLWSDMKFLEYLMNHEGEEVILPSKWLPNVYSYNVLLDG